MPATILDGKATAAEVKADLRARVDALKAAGKHPGLGTVLVGEDPGSHAYVSGKHRDCAEVGIESIRVDLPADTTQAQLDAASLQFTLVINPVIYAELSIAYQRIEELETMLKAAGLRLDPIPREALFLAGRAFLNYRKRRGTKSGVLPDFFIGAHAAVAGLPLLTRDTSRFVPHCMD